MPNFLLYCTLIVLVMFTYHFFAYELVYLFKFNVLQAHINSGFCLIFSFIVSCVKLKEGDK